MNENIQELKDGKLKEYEEKYKKIHELQVKEISETQDQKYQNALTKIKTDLTSKITKINSEIVKEQQKYREEVTVKFEKMMLKEQKKI